MKRSIMRGGLPGELCRLQPGRFELDLHGPELVDLALQFGESLVIAGRGSHLLVQGREPLLESGNLLFQASEILLAWRRAALVVDRASTDVLIRGLSGGRSRRDCRYWSTPPGAGRRSRLPSRRS